MDTPEPRPYIYMAEPIDRGSLAGRSETLLQSLDLGHGINYYSPRMAWRAAPPFTAAIQQVNDLALARASAVVALISSEVASTGVPMEVQQAIALEIPVVVWADFEPTDSAVWAKLVETQEVEWVRWFKGEPYLAVGRSIESVVIDLVHRPRSILDDTPVVGRFTNWADAQTDGPQSGKPGDAGYDLGTSQATTIRAGMVESVPTGMAVELPQDMWGLIQGRSSSWRRGLLVKGSTIDAGYRGPLFIDVWNIGKNDVTIEVGERIGQLIPMFLAPPIRFLRVDELSSTERGTSGYGSTGR